MRARNFRYALDNLNFTSIAVHLNPITVVDTGGRTGANNGRDAEVPCDNRPVREHAATLDDQPPGVHE